MNCHGQLPEVSAECDKAEGCTVVCTDRLLRLLGPGVAVSFGLARHPTELAMWP